MIRRLDDIVGVSSTIGSERRAYNTKGTGNRIKGVLMQKSEDIVLPSGRVLFEKRKAGENTMLIGATQMIAKAFTGNTTGEIKILTLDEDLKTTITPQKTVVREEQVYCGVMLCNGGADGSVVKAVYRYMPGFTSANRIPWRVVPTASEDVSVMYQDYACRSVEGSNAKYYLKKLKNITWLNRTIDGETPLTDRPDQQLSGNVAVETVIKTEFDIKLEDMAEHYASIGENVRRKFSTIGLYLGNTVTCEVNGKSGQDHRKLICANQLNIEEEFLKQNKEAKYEYNIHIR